MNTCDCPKGLLPNTTEFYDFMMFGKCPHRRSRSYCGTCGVDPYQVPVQSAMSNEVDAADVPVPDSDSADSDSAHSNSAQADTDLYWQAVGRWADLPHAEPDSFPESGSKFQLTAEQSLGAVPRRIAQRLREGSRVLPVNGDTDGFVRICGWERNHHSNCKPNHIAFTMSRPPRQHDKIPKHRAPSADFAFSTTVRLTQLA